MRCLHPLEGLSASVDGEATAEERAAVERQAASCPHCAARLESLRALKHAVGRLDGRATPPEAIQARIQALRFAPRSVREGLRERVTWPRAAGAVAAALLLAIGVTSVRRESGDGHALFRELVADHVRSAPEAMPAEVASGSAADVRRFFQGRVPFDPVVPTLRAARLSGGRVCKIAGRKVELLFYDLGGRRLSLYVTDRPAGGATCHEEGGYAVCGARRDDLSLLLVGEASGDELRAVLNGATP